MTTKSADGVALALSESMSSLEGEARALALTLVRLLAEAEADTKLSSPSRESGRTPVRAPTMALTDR